MTVERAKPTSPAQNQFLDVIDRDEAERRFRAVLDLRPLEPEVVPLVEAWQRVLAADIVAPVDVPGFDRANVDGFALRAEDTFGAAEQVPIRLRINAERLTTGVAPQTPISPGRTTLIATGAVVPRGADAVVMVEDTDLEGEWLLVRRPMTPGANITFAGTDIGQGETVLRRGELLTSRETGVLAALGLSEVPVVHRPRVAILSTGDEIVPPGEPLRAGLVFDSNATILADAVRELGGEPVAMGIAPDDAPLLRERLRAALAHDLIVLSGGTSKGAGDLSYRVVEELGPPGIVVHGVALKPGKPLCLAAAGNVPIAVLPGFPTSAVFTFHEFVAPIIRILAGRSQAPVQTVRARLPVRVNSERGRTEYLLVGLVAAPSTSSPDLVAYPMGKGSGSVTTFSKADGFITIPRQREYLEADEVVDVQLLAQGLQPAELVVIGSHCVGLDWLLGQLRDQGVRSKVLAVGSTAGLLAARRGECDIAGIHLMDPATKEYNRPFVGDDLRFLRGYRRMQGLVFRPGDKRFAGHTVETALHDALGDASCLIVNRNRGSGTRILIDMLLKGAQPPGYAVEARSHNAVAAAVVQERADWGLCIDTVARQAGLSFLPVQEECFDFVVPRLRWDRPEVQAFRELLDRPAIRQALTDKGFRS
jgi:molybdopterin molybdotransferase/putative molybdopterin biosynthesis protein